MTLLSSNRARLLAAVAAGATQAAAHARMEWALGTIVAAALLATAVDAARPRIGAACGLVFGAIVGVSFAPQAAGWWMVAIGLLCFGVLCALMGMAGAASTAARRPAWLAAVGLPVVAWVYESLNGLGPLGDYLGLAVALVGLDLLVPLARLGGPGTLAAAGVGIGVVLAYGAAPARRPAMIGAGCGWVLLIVVANSGAPGSDALVVGAVVHTPDASGPAVLRQLARATRQAAREGARVVVWPEAALRVDGLPPASRETWDVVSATAAETGATLVVGAFVASLDQNLAVLVTPADGVGPTYSKNHLIPGMERYTPGRAPPSPWTGAPVPIGAVICFDDCFARDPNRLARAGVAVLAVPTNDWPRVQHRHRRLSMLRAAQAGVPLVRAASGGFSQIVGPDGRLIAASGPPTDAPVVLVGTVPVGR